MTQKTVKEGELTIEIQHRLIEEIAERKQAEDDLFIVLDMDGSVLYCNPAARALLEKREGELLGQPFGLPVADIEIGMEISTKDRGVRRVDMRAAPGHWQGRDARVIWLHDRTEQLRAVEELAKGSW